MVRYATLLISLLAICDLNHFESKRVIVVLQTKKLNKYANHRIYQPALALVYFRVYDWGSHVLTNIPGTKIWGIDCL